jgi:hypothetical protein
MGEISKTGGEKKFGFDCLTWSEARYLEKSPDARAIRDRLIAAGLEGSSGAPSRGPEPVTPGDGE